MTESSVNEPKIEITLADIATMDFETMEREFIAVHLSGEAKHKIYKKLLHEFDVTIKNKKELLADHSKENVEYAEMYFEALLQGRNYENHHIRVKEYFRIIDEISQMEEKRNELIMRWNLLMND